MEQKISDLRILHLALAIEESLEKLQTGLAKHLKQAELKRAIAGTQIDGAAHIQLKEAYSSLNRELAKIETSELDVLQALLEGEQIARDFYRDWSVHLSNSKYADLFAALQKEEQHHADLIGAAIAKMKPKGI